MQTYTFKKLMEEAQSVTKKDEGEAYEMEIELDGGMTFRCDIKDLDKLMIKLQTIGNALGGAK